MFAFLLPLGLPPSPHLPLPPPPQAHRVADEGGADEHQKAEAGHDLGGGERRAGVGGGRRGRDRKVTRNDVQEVRGGREQ